MNWIWVFVFPVMLIQGLYEDDYKLTGNDFLQGIQDIIGADPNLPRNEISSKPFVGSFSTFSSKDDKHFLSVSYCMTDNACGHFEAYSRKDVPLSLLYCNKFCYIDKDSKKYVESQQYTIDHPPALYLNCGWETCG